MNGMGGREIVKDVQIAIEFDANQWRYHITRKQQQQQKLLHNEFQAMNVKIDLRFTSTHTVFIQILVRRKKF